MELNEYQTQVLALLNSGLVAIVATGVLLVLLAGIRTARGL